MLLEPGDPIDGKDLTFASKQGCVFYKGQRIRLPKTTFDVLHCIHAGHPDFVSNEDLRKGVWGTLDRDENLPQQHVTKLNKKLPNFGFYVHSVPNSGYVLAQIDNGSPRPLNHLDEQPRKHGVLAPEGDLRGSSKYNKERRILLSLGGQGNEGASVGTQTAVTRDWEDEVEFEDGESSGTKHPEMQLSEDAEFMEDEHSGRLWTKCTSTHLHKALHDREWAWAAEPFPLGKPVKDVVLVYHKAGPRYDTLLNPLARKALDKWCKESANAERLSKEPWGLQVRITHAGFNHSKHVYEIHLAPSKFLYYTAIQQNLWKADLMKLRSGAIANALLGIDKEEPLLLPSAFSTHMAVVSSDGMALLRQRSARTSLYSLAWEAGVGEFMHGPKKTQFPHFTPQGTPSLYLFLKNAVAEELDYPDAKIKDFRIYGIAAEYRTLAPKLIAVYSADIPIDRLMKGAQQAKDNSPNVQAIELTVDGIAAALSNPTYRTWGPTSKLALLLALIQRSRSNTVVEQLERKMKQMNLV